MKSFVNVGCGPKQISQPIPCFNNTEEWTEIRYDIDESVSPDVVGSMTDMSALADASVDALFSSHNIEHLYVHDVPVALREFFRVLKPEGFAVVLCPDLQSVCALVADNKLTDPAYMSAAGPISPHDILYGHGDSLRMGNLYMAHRCGFTQNTLAAAMQSAGFTSVTVIARPEHFDLWAIASKQVMSPAELVELVL